MSEVYERTYKILLACLMLMTLVSGCSGTGTGNPTITAGPDNTSGSQTYASALPDPLLSSNDIIPEGFVGVIYPDLFVSVDDMLFVGGANRGLQLVDVPLDQTPILGGSISIPGTYRDLCLLDSQVQLLKATEHLSINIFDEDQPFIEDAITLGTDTFRIFSYNSGLVRLSHGAGGMTEVDLVTAQEMDQAVTKGLILPIQVSSGKRYEERLWLRGLSPANGKSYLMGIDLARLLVEPDLIDLSGMISALPDLDPDSPVFAMTEVPGTDLTTDLLYPGPSIPRTMEMLHGIWMDVPLYTVISDQSLYIYDLNNNGLLLSVVPISFQPESFVTKDSAINFSYIKETDAPEGADPSKSYSQFFYKSFDLSDPANPVESGEVNIPGTLLSLDGDQVFTLDFSWDAGGNIIETVKTGQVAGNSVTVTGEFPLSGRTTNRFVSGSNVIVILAGDASNWSDLIRIIDFFDPENPIQTGE